MRKNKTHWQEIFLEFLRYSAFLLFLAGMAALLILTRPFAAVREKQQTLKELKIVLHQALPPFDNQAWNNTIQIGGRKIYIAKTEKVLAPGVIAYGIEGEKSGVKLMSGISVSGHLTGVKLLESPKELSVPHEEFFSSLQGADEKTIGMIGLDGSAQELSRKIIEIAYEDLKFYNEHQKEIWEKSGYRPPQTAPLVSIRETKEEQVAGKVPDKSMPPLEAPYVQSLHGAGKNESWEEKDENE